MYKKQHIIDKEGKVRKGECFPLYIKPCEDYSSLTHIKISLIAGQGGCIIFSFMDKIPSDIAKTGAILSKLYLMK
jgi:hypothetical protein